MLYPQTNKHRMAISLNGIWNFAFVEENFVPSNKLENPRLVGVPASFTDLFTEIMERDYVGKVVYERSVTIPNTGNKTDWYIRVGAAGNRTYIYVDGELLYSHNGGFLPLDFKLPSAINSTFRLSIVLDTRLDFQTLPIGEIIDSRGKQKQLIHYDFANYIGIHRNVYLYSKHPKSINDIVIETTQTDNEATVKYLIDSDEIDCLVHIYDQTDTLVATSKGLHNEVIIQHPNLWDIGCGNLYKLTAETEFDYYEENFGIRDFKVVANKLLLNNKEVYLKGFGMHEDHITIGKGSISGLNIRDFNLLKWINANSFRTSHYPYSEEMYDLADKYGILIINEMPAVGMNFWDNRAVFTPEKINEESQNIYIEQFNELIKRDKNHPSIIMYSIANEANTHEGGAYDFFKPLFDNARTKTKLPLMIVEWVGAKENKVAQLADVIGINRYIGWYVDFADLDIIEEKLSENLEAYYNKFKKPILLSEFGSDTISGLHKLPAVAFSEEFQVEFIKRYQDTINKFDFVIGEHVWNFADFQTKQGLTRFDGNKKGVFTRDRQPKMIAYHLKKNWENK